MIEACLSPAADSLVMAAAVGGLLLLLVSWLSDPSKESEDYRDGR